MIPIDVENFPRRFPELAEALGPPGVQQLLDACSVQDAIAGEALIAEGTPADALYLVWDGELDVSMQTPTGEQEVAQVGAGELLGEVSLLDPGPATATVRTEQGCIALRLDRRRLESMWDDDVEVASVLLDELCRATARRIAGSTARLAELLAARGPSRLDDAVAVHTLLYTGGS